VKRKKAEDLAWGQRKREARPPPSQGRRVEDKHKEYGENK
jgi:hypothetical protein